MSAYDAHHRDLLAFARALVRDPEAAEDLVADAFLRLINEVRAGRAPAETRGWLYRVVANLVVSRGRRLRTAQRFLSRLVDRRVQESPESSLVEIRDPVGPARSPRGAADRRPGRSRHGRPRQHRPRDRDGPREERDATRTVLYRARIRLREQLSEGVETVTDHRRWLELAAMRPTFSPSAADATDLDAHLAACEACSREAAALRADLALVARLEVPAPRDDVRMRIRAAAIAADVGRGSWNLATIAAVGLLAAAAGRGDARRRRIADPARRPALPARRERPHWRPSKASGSCWATEVVQLGADCGHDRRQRVDAPRGDAAHEGLRRTRAA